MGLKRHYRWCWNLQTLLVCIIFLGDLGFGETPKFKSEIEFGDGYVENKTYERKKATGVVKWKNSKLLGLALQN